MDLYCKNLLGYKRFETRVVNIGELPLGGNNPIRIQSMTTTDTMDTAGTIEQVIKMVNSGCEIVRITAPNISAAENLKNIKEGLLKKGIKVPLVADIHFTPNAAEAAARIVEKVRINPGNYTDKKKFKTIEYTDKEYNEELERIYERFAPLVKICKEYGTAMRIGTNHGSLSDRIMSRFGDTPLGMVESAFEFLRICEDLNYYDIVLSMKASNTRVMIQAYRLLVKKMIETGRNYPLHLGVTEAGDGDDARIKSSVGIGALLLDGIGDTIRVSLTEPPEFEAPVAKQIINIVDKITPDTTDKDYSLCYDPYNYKRLSTKEVYNLGGLNLPTVTVSLNDDNLNLNGLKEVDLSYNENDDKWHLGDFAPDIIYTNKKISNINLPPNILNVYTKELLNDKNINFVELTKEKLTNFELSSITDKSVLVLKSGVTNAAKNIREQIFRLREKNINNPLILKICFNEEDYKELLIKASAEFGLLLSDGLGDGIWIENKNNSIPAKKLVELSFGILQATRTRISKTEYIACPSCGRTLFDLVDVTAKIREKTSHLKGVKIGIMGCIVNGPGEMADADYGYVGSGPGKITLYKGKEVVKRSVPSEEAVEELINIIKDDGRWVEK